ERLRRLPKVDLHRHLEASARLETLWEFHQASGERMHASLEAFRRAVVIPEGETPGFAAFLGRFMALRFCYGGERELERLAREVVADAAADGVVHLELRLHPAFWARRMSREHTAAAPTTAGSGETISAAPLSTHECERAFAALARGARSEAQARGISVGFILSLGRHADAGTNRAAAELIHRPAGAEFCGVDVAGDEALPLDPVLPFVRMCAGRGLPVTLHAGEDPRPEAGGARGVREALERHAAVRIGHGVRAVEDPAVLAALCARGAALEVCLTSNVQTAAAADFASHPVHGLLAAGVRVTLNTDDPLLSDISLTDEYLRAHERAGLPLETLRGIAVNGAEAAFLPADRRAALKSLIADAWDAQQD
ncbi:MAG: adenosine deaminase family protein, partial [Planctomycetota bacterium]|nr:adenosine deaminase family protein [Planctomycetota bacterium]